MGLFVPRKPTTGTSQSRNNSEKANSTHFKMTRTHVTTTPIRFVQSYWPRSMGIVLAWLLTAHVSLPAADWPQWGGRQMRNMHSAEKGLPDNFGKVEFKSGTEEIDPKATKNLKWAAKL